MSVLGPIRSDGQVLLTLGIGIGRALVIEYSGFGEGSCMVAWSC